MPPSPSRRALAVLTLAALLALSSPGIARAQPIDRAGEPRGFIQQFLDGAAAWVQSFLVPLWQAGEGDNGSGLDPNGRPTSSGDTGSGLDPDGRP